MKIFKGREEVPIEELRGMFLTAMFWFPEHSRVELPLKNEEIICLVVEKADRDGTPILRVESCRIQDYVEAPKLDARKFLGPIEEERSEIMEDALEKVKRDLEHD
jgi:hypothetical protein